MSRLSVCVALLWSAALLLLSSPIGCAGRNYAVLVSSIKGWENLAYSVQADVCHQYALLLSTGMTHDDIILMSYGDAAWDSFNAFPGQLFNRGTNNRSKPVDVNADCHAHIDYIGYEVSPANFLAVITGNRSAVPAGRPVLESTSEDNVFISFEDHGSPGAVYCHTAEHSHSTAQHPPCSALTQHTSQRPPTAPHTAYRHRPHVLLVALSLSVRRDGCAAVGPDFKPMYAVDLLDALHTMHSRYMYQRLVFYLMACESGSMFAKGMLPANISIYATAAASPDVSAYPVYCTPNDLVGGQPSGLSINRQRVSNCLASEFGLAWTNETEAQGLAQSLDDQFRAVNASMITSTPGQYGDLTWKGMPLGNVWTDYPSFKTTAGPVWADNGVHTLMPEDVGRVSMAPGSFKLFMLQNSIRMAEPGGEEEAEAKADLAAELSRRAELDQLFSAFATSALSSAGKAGLKAELLMAAPALPIVHTECMRRVDEAIARECGGYDDYSRGFARLVINTCRAVAELSAEAEAQLPQLMDALCQQSLTVRPVYPQAKAE